ncbi:U3 small nucleolar RNA-associated protein 10 [Talaromyces islandicus]|uniref:U3 small nucleolar RNA-associated protein 10 n=1 Tax=Talaromyces islandicus TaxID=28573 RepID=A0A0U1MB44_TALIS|nr:U3 small nucleolar RNA-associated protein 10 [Talaromyces islandicus]
MASHDYKDEGPEPVTGALGGASADSVVNQSSPDLVSSKKLDLPSADSILSALQGPASVTSTENQEEITPEEEDRMFRALQEVLNQESDAESFDLQKLHDSLETADAAAQRGQRNPRLLGDVASILERLWRTRSKYMPRAVEALANGSREPSWRTAFGQSGVLEFFLQLVATREEVEEQVLFHSLRLIGNSCADTDENREIVVSNNSTLPIIRLILNPGLVHVAIPVIYNICMDFEPAQSQVAANRLGYILLKLISDGAIEGNALLNFAYELVSITAEKEDGIANSPDGTIILIMDLAINKDTTFAQFACLVECLSSYLQNERFQNACVQHGLVEKLLSVLRHSYDINVDQSSSEDVKLLAQTQLKLNQTISDVSAVSTFAEVYPVGSPLFNSLKSWMTESEDQLQICASVILGNLARSDEVCRLMISELNIHQSLIAMLKNKNARGSVLHTALGFLKNLAILEENRGKLGEADIIPTVSRLWTSDTIPQVQLVAVSLIRLVINSSVENISRFLTPLSSDPDSPAHLRTYLSLLLSLLNRTDSTPIKTEIGRTVASICRTLGSRSREGNSEASSLFDRLFDLHEDVARPIDAMITQTEWPVVRSEGWFALALMASHVKGSLAVADRLYNTDVYQLVEDTLEGGNISETDNASIQKAKDRENLVVMIKELLDNDPDTLSEGRKARLKELVSNAVAGSGQPAS